MINATKDYVLHYRHLLTPIFQLFTAQIIGFVVRTGNEKQNKEKHGLWFGVNKPKSMEISAVLILKHSSVKVTVQKYM